MDNKHHNPSANVPIQDTDEPSGDRGQGDKTWSSGDQQGISNRVGDENNSENLENDLELDEERRLQREKDMKPNR
jgi:hypothetical protein